MIGKAPELWTVRTCRVNVESVSCNMADDAQFSRSVSYLSLEVNRMYTVHGTTQGLANQTKLAPEAAPTCNFCVVPRDFVTETQLSCYS